MVGSRLMVGTIPGTNEKLYSNISSKKLIGGDDENSMGMIMLAVVMGCSWRGSPWRATSSSL